MSRILVGDWGYLLIKYEWVGKESPILVQVIAMSWTLVRRLKLEGVFYLLIVFFFFKYFRVCWTFWHICQDKWIFWLIEFFMSLVGTLFVLGLRMVFIAWSEYLSAFSFPAILMWDGTHRNSMFFFVWIKHAWMFDKGYIIFWGSFLIVWYLRVLWLLVYRLVLRYLKI